MRTIQECSTRAAYLLGDNTHTVVYICPDGKARVCRDSQDPAQALTAPQLPGLVESVLPGQEIEARIDQLLAQGTLTPAQVQVGRYDQKTSGLPLLETLVARGWLVADQIP